MRHEHYLAHRLNVTAGYKVLDLGCGIGGPAKEIATFADCKVVAVTNNAYQIQIGQEIAQKEGVGEDKLELILGDFMVCIHPLHYKKQRKSTDLLSNYRNFPSPIIPLMRYIQWKLLYMPHP